MRWLNYCQSCPLPVKSGVTSASLVWLAWRSNGLIDKMEIQYLTLLRDNPIANPSTPDFLNAIEPITLQEIAQLEQLYNSGNPFPKALKELLYLAGKSCYVLDYGIRETKAGMQDYVRSKMAAKNRTLPRPFFAIDVYNAGDQFLFVFLDEGDNPPTYEGLYYYDPEVDSDYPQWYHPLGVTLSELIDHKVDRVKQGRNPF